MASVYQKILEEGKKQSFTRVEESRQWFRNAATNISKYKISPSQVISEKKSNLNINQNDRWSLLLYNYSPKGKADLPYYDAFPIVFPFRLTEDGFYGYNLHYLPPPLRAVLMDQGIYASKGASKWFSPCIKRYITKNIRSKIATIPKEEWELALFLPMQRFQKASDIAVWSDSIKKVTRK